jgi:hypothetical protein
MDGIRSTREEHENYTDIKNIYMKISRADTTWITTR